MNGIIQQIIISMATIVCSIFASSGFWTLFQRKREGKDAKTRLLIGLAHDRIIFLGLKYIERGYILESEYEDLVTYLWEPYEDAGGNGSAKKVMDEVKKLKVFSSHEKAREVLHLDETARQNL